MDGCPQHEHDRRRSKEVVEATTNSLTSVFRVEEWWLTTQLVDSFAILMTTEMTLMTYKMMMMMQHLKTNTD